MEFHRKAHSVLLLACGLLSVGTSASNAADITFLGSDTTTGAAWRSTSAIKNPTFDPSGDNAYGTDGYYLPANKTGDGPATIASSLPSFISSCQLHGAVPNYSSATYVRYDNPTLGISTTVADQQGAIWYFNSTDTTDPKYGMVGFTLTTDAHFVLTIVLSQGRPSGTGGNSALAVQQVANFWDTATLASAEVTNAQMPAFASHADYLFFEINGHAGDNFAISMNGAQNSGFAGIAFETVPVRVAASPPSFTPPEGTYAGPQAVSITAESGAIIRYTTDGTNPNANSPVYSGPITVPSGTTRTIKAFASVAGKTDSTVASATYIIGSQLVLDGNQLGRTFEGIGGVSAGASSRLLVDYPEPQRSQLLDYLFKPNFGAGLQHLKVEIGSGVNSTDGTEPSHQRTATDENYDRGYEWWLMEQAKARNPDVLLDCLAWGAPGWIGGGNYQSQDMCDYIADFIEGAQIHHGLTMDYVGTHNETPVSTTWIKQLRATLDARGLQATQLVAADLYQDWSIVTDMQSDPELYDAVSRVGEHYPGDTGTPPVPSSPLAAQTLGKPLWASEDWSKTGNWSGAVDLAQRINRNYIAAKITKTEVWCPINSFYDCLPFPGTGLMNANQPWSGYFEVWPAIWAAAHTTQFAYPGWTYLEGDASAMLPSGGSMVTLVSPNHSDYSVVVETSGAVAGQATSFQLAGGLSTAPVQVWKTTQSDQFIHVGQIVPVNGSYSYTFDPASIYTLTTTTGQSKGNAVSPVAAALPLPFQDNFESYGVEKTPKYFSDTNGSFETFARADGQGQCLRQVVTQRGIDWLGNWFPTTIIGESNRRDYDVSADVLIEPSDGFVFIFGRVESVALGGQPNGYWLALNTTRWELRTANGVIASGAANAPANTWHNLGLSMNGTNISCSVDGVVVASVTNATYSKGNAGLGSGWHSSQFDNFKLSQKHYNGFSLTSTATATASSTWSSEYNAPLAIDENLTTRWNSAQGQITNQWLQLDWPAPVTFDHTNVSEFASRVSSYVIQHWDGSDWVTDFSGTTIGANKTDSFPPVTASKIRLLILAASSTPSIIEFQVFSGQAPVNVRINEWMVNNTHTLAEQDGTYGSWFELYNPGTTDVDLTGWYLTGSKTNPFQFQIPTGFTVPAEGYRLVWADGRTNIPAPELHANFTLAESQIIGLFDADKKFVDAVDLTPQAADASYGSLLDGGSDIVGLPTPTPEGSNSSNSLYQEWAGGRGFTDPNAEGVPYGLAWMLGATSNSDSALPLLPRAENRDNGLVMHFHRVHDVGSATLHLQYNGDLGTWPNPGVLIPASLDGVGILPGSDVTYKVIRGSLTDDITVTIPDSHAVDGKLFGRLSPAPN